ncbi:GNAT family N-acetyltransferase [Kitasatospora mediocidica]|uniref:GNAT family N-acetyltransferase n=1 Tax=Kitasatospora mediocidica TaxID=58352 RepID=UPI00069240FE|nr:GNAT family N-acetyltransferase [Kitasatospora mediocidica]
MSASVPSPAGPPAAPAAAPAPVLRRLDLTDEATARAVHRVARRGYAVEAALIDFDGIPPLHESLAELRAQPLCWLGAVTRDGELAAFVGWAEPAGGGVIDIDRVCVDPRWFRAGLASRLLSHLLTELRPDTDALVSTGARNLPAVRLYERLGFAPLDVVEPVPGLRLARFRLTRS